MHCFYRISDNSYPKAKLPGCTKEWCFDHFKSEFWWDDIDRTIIADRCKPETIEFLNRRKASDVLHETDLGNSGSFRYALQLACQLPPDEVVYFVEDDYVHKDGVACVIADAPPFDYWTAYDHPDKYLGGIGGEEGFVTKTKHTHWRQTISTTMTFATRVKTLLRDMDAWLRYTKYDPPQDHHIFEWLWRERQGRHLACAIPGRSWHADMTESFKHGKLLFDIDCLYYLAEVFCGYLGKYENSCKIEDMEYIDEVRWEVTQGYEYDPTHMKALVPLIKLAEEVQKRTTQP